MTDDLVNRLRCFDPYLDEIEVVDEAADRIESDAATIARLDGDVKLWQDRYHHHNRERMDALNCNARQAGMISQAVVAQREAEAKVAALVNASMPFADIGISQNPDHQPMIRMDRDAIIALRAAIAAAKEGA